MNKNLLIILLLLLIATSIFALPVSGADASRVARNFATERMGSNYTVSEAIA